MKKFVNRPELAVSEMIEGLIAAYPGFRRLPGQPVIVRSGAKAKAEKVAIVSGGGSGHEPAHAGYIGLGMLDAAVLGDVFASPSVDAVAEAIRAVGGAAGTVLIVKNYTGDRLNFGLAAEIARSEGLPVEVVIVADDVALADSTDLAGRRGLAGTVLVHKIAGAAAEAGMSLARVATEARSAASAVRTMGVALGACTVPAAGKPSFSLGDAEIEIGLGIHGEPGVRKAAIEPSDALVDRLLAPIVADLGLGEGSRVALMVNNLGGTPTMELAIVARRAIAELEARKVAVERVYLGTFLSSLEMPGASLTAFSLTDAWLDRLDAPTDAPAWPNAANRPRTRVPVPWAPPGEEEWPSTASTRLGPPKTAVGKMLDAAVRAVVRALKAESARLSELDRVVGDGDLGASLARGAEMAQNVLALVARDDPNAALLGVGLAIQRAAGGTSGPLYAAGVLRAAARMKTGPADDPIAWAEALRAGASAVSDLGGAGPGDRTMLDALLPACDALDAALKAGKSPADALASAVSAAEAGARATAFMKPRRGRSSYLGDRALGHVDPGAEAVVVWLRALAETSRANP